MAAPSWMMHPGRAFLVSRAFLIAYQLSARDITAKPAILRGTWEFENSTRNANRCWTVHDENRRHRDLAVLLGIDLSRTEKDDIDKHGGKCNETQNPELLHDLPLSELLHPGRCGSIGPRLDLKFG